MKYLKTAVVVIAFVFALSSQGLSVEVTWDGGLILSAEEEKEVLEAYENFDIVPLLAATADAIVIGKPLLFLQNAPRWYAPDRGDRTRRLPPDTAVDPENTQIVIKVDKILKGDVDNGSLTINCIGVHVNGERTIAVVDGAPTFQLGQEQLLFLSHDVGHTFNVTAGFSGAFALVDGTARNDSLQLIFAIDEFMTRVTTLVKHPEEISPPHLKSFSVDEIKRMLEEKGDIPGPIGIVQGCASKTWCRRRTGEHAPYSPLCFQPDSCPYRYYYPFSSTNEALNWLICLGYVPACTPYVYDRTKLDTSWRWSSQFCLPMPPGFFRWQGWTTTGECSGSAAQAGIQGPEPNPDICSYVLYYLIAPPLWAAWVSYVYWWHAYYC